MPFAARALYGLVALLSLAACDRAGDGTLQVAAVGAEDGLFVTGLRLATGAQHLRAATAEGLVGMDANGEVSPAMADRWIVTDDGQSYIFRLRDGNWADGSELTSQSARDALVMAIDELGGTALGKDLEAISEIRTMAGRVVEIRLEVPMADFLQLLAQPELGLIRKSGVGPMQATRTDDTVLLDFLAPEARGLPEQPGWRAGVRPLRFRALPAAAAIAQFDDGVLDVVLNGRFDAFPLVDTGPLSRGTVRLDPAIGLFGLRIVEEKGILADPTLREALSMAIDRDALPGLVNVGGWASSTRILPPDMPGDLGTIGERWTEISFEDRQAEAARRVAAWMARNNMDAAPSLRISLPRGPGAGPLYDLIARDLGRIGIKTRRVRLDEDADLRLVDVVARYASARWFLNQFHCSLRGGVCSPLADALVAESLRDADGAARAALLTEAEAELTAANGFIPLGQPIRWSLVRSGIPGFANNRWAFHPLPSLATIPR